MAEIDTSAIGWPNRETMAVYQYIAHDEDLYEMASSFRADAVNIEDRSLQKMYISEKLRHYFTQTTESVLSGAAELKIRIMIVNIGSMWRVDWEEVAQAILRQRPV